MNIEALMSAPQHVWSGFEGYLLAHPPVIAAFIGPTLAFVLSQVATYIQLNAATKKQGEAVRKLIEAERSHNLKLLGSLKKKIGSKTLEQENGSYGEFVIDPRLVPFPNWQQKAFESQLPILPKVFGKEIEELYEFYSRLNTLTDIHSKLLSLQKALDGARQAERTEDITKLTSPEALFDFRSSVKFADKLQRTWEEFEEHLKRD